MENSKPKPGEHERQHYNPTVTLYVPQKDKAIWERAKRLAARAKLSLSQFVTKALEQTNGR